jgi:hypothetical protein
LDSSIKVSNFSGESSSTNGAKMNKKLPAERIFVVIVLPLIIIGLHTIATSPKPNKNAVALTTNQLYYVAVNEVGANNSNNGLFPTYQGGVNGPWLSIKHAAAQMVAGDTTYVREGTYYESNIGFANSGTATSRITLTNYPGESVIIDGSLSGGGYSGIWIDQTPGFYTVNGLTIRNMPSRGIVTARNTAVSYQDITISNSTLHNNGWNGVELAAVNGFLVDNVVSHDNAYYGLNIAASQDGALSSANGIVQNSTFYNHTTPQGHGLAINQGHHITVTNSIAYHNTMHGFDVSDWPKYGDLSHNIVIKDSFSYDNGIAGFAINSSSHHVIFRRNIAWKNGAEWAATGGGSGFWCYAGCWHVEWLHNVSIENKEAGFWIEKEEVGDYGTPDDYLIVFKNNITFNNNPENLWNWAPGLVVEALVGPESWQLIATNNDWHVLPGASIAVHDQGTEHSPADVNQGTFQSGNLSVDPLFVNASLPDVHLTANSPAIDNGVDVGLFYLGDAPDMGVFESDGLIFLPFMIRVGS